MKFRTILACLLIAGFVATLSTPAVLGQKKKVDPNIAYRQKVMKSISANMGGIRDIVTANLGFKRNIAGHAQNVNNNAMMIVAAFKNKVLEGPTDAKAKIWDDRKNFKKAAKALQRESAKLQKMWNTNNKKKLGAQLKATYKTCGGCHKEFRKKKEDSYKRKKM